MRSTTFALVPALSLVLAAEDPAALAIIKRSQKQQDALKLQYQAHLQMEKDPRAFRPDCSKALKQIEEDLNGGPKGEVLEALLVAKLHFARSAGTAPAELNALALRTRQEVPGRSRAWIIDPALLLILATPAMEAEALASNPEPRVRAHVLLSRGEKALRSQRGEEAAAILQQLQAGYPKEPATQAFKEQFEKARPTFPGATVPDFQVKDMDDSKQVYTRGHFKGKYLLIDFWATWCGPCRQEMPGLHKAWERFKGRPFEILSLSFDESASVVRSYRKQPATPMPWKHVFVQDGFESPLAQAFGVKGIPKPVLVGPDGRILASGDELRGEEDLLRVLEKHLGK